MLRRTVGSMLLVSALALVTAGCSATKANTACEPVDNAITVCLNGKAMDFSKEKTQPHRHENGNLYAPIVPVAEALGIKIEIDTEKKTAVVNGKTLEVISSDEIKGIHVHEMAMFVPMKEFAAATGLEHKMDVDKGVIGFAK